MKNVLSFIRTIIILSAVAILSSCGLDELIGIKGSGPVVSREIETGKVTGILLEIPATVYLTRGDVQKMTIDAQENIQSNIEYYNSNGILRLGYIQPVLKSEPVIVYLTLQSITEIKNTGSGSIQTTNGFETNGQMKIEISGSGDMELNANAQSVVINIYGSGNLNLKSSTKQVEGVINGSGDINLTAENVEWSTYKINGSGNINAFPTISKSCYVETNGSGNVKVNVSEKLTVKIFGSGDVYYHRNPQVSATINGSGHVLNAD
ncbi:MAG: head GIN domain-containing protein [Bacteroidales bacterium]